LGLTLVSNAQTTLINTTTGLIINRGNQCVDSTLTVKGRTILQPRSLTGSAATSALSTTQTWNTTGNPTLIFANVTNTASGSSSLLMDLQVSGVSQFLVSKTGSTQTRSNLIPINSNAADLGSSGNRWKDCYFGVVDARRIRNTAAVATDIVVIAKGFTGQTANLFEGQDVLNNVIFSVNPIGAVSSLYQRFGNGTPEGSVTAPVGAVYHRTDGGAGTSFYVKQSGTGNTGWIAK
jgi:hypothetical protein